MSGPSSSRATQDLVAPACSSSRVSDPIPGIGRSMTYFFIGTSGWGGIRGPKVPRGEALQRRLDMPFYRGALAWPHRAMLLGQAMPLDQTDSNGVRHGGRLRRDVELEPNVREMAMRGVMADEQLVRDLALAQAVRDQTEHFHLALGERRVRRDGTIAPGFLQ